MTQQNDSNNIPTLYEWAGGISAFEKLMDVFYKKVLNDPLLEPIFKHMSPLHQSMWPIFWRKSSEGLRFTVNRMEAILKWFKSI